MENFEKMATAIFQTPKLEGRKTRRKSSKEASERKPQNLKTGDRWGVPRSPNIPPEVFHRLYFTKPKLWRFKPVTICAAGINQSGDTCIIAVCDRKLSLGSVAAEGMAWKMQTIHPKWRVMFAGPVSPLVALIDAIKTEAANAPDNSLRSFARLCSRAYRSERKNIVETEILAGYDIGNYSEYLALKQSDRILFDAISQEIKNSEDEWSLLFVGFDKHDRPHLFVICEFGKIQYCDNEGFAAIGSGAWAAWGALARFGFNRFISRGESIFGILSAKFAAEGVDGVGEETILVLLKPTDQLGRKVPVLNVAEVKKHRAAWNKLPSIPDGAAESLETYFAATERKVKDRVPNPLEGYLKPEKNKGHGSRRSVAQRLKPGP